MAAHRYWRILPTTTQSATDLSLREIELRETIGGADVTGSGTATAPRELLGFEAAKAFDNNLGTTWSAQHFSLTTPGPVPGVNNTVFTQPPGSLSIVDFGAVGDGVTDNYTAIQNALDAGLAQGKEVWVPPGTWAWGNPTTPEDILDMGGQTLSGAGKTSILYAKDYVRSSLYISGDGAVVKNLKFDGDPAPGRQAAWNSTKISPAGATNFTITNNWIVNAPAASIHMAPLNHVTNAAGCSGGTISFNTIQNSLSDSIHMTDGANNMTVEYNVVENSGDDGIACVSYASYPNRCHDIIARYNVVDGVVAGRNMSVVGGQDVYYYSNLMKNNPNAAGLYIAQETPFATYNVLRVKCELNTIINCGNDSNGHAGIMVYSDGTYNGGEANDDVYILRNDVDQSTRPTLNGIRAFGPQTNIRFEQNLYTGSGTAVVDDGAGTVITLNVPYSSGAVGYLWYPSITYDFGAATPKDILQVQLTSWQASQFLGLWLFQFSDDNVTWTTQWTINDTPLADNTSRLYSADVAALPGSHAPKLGIKMSMSL